MPAWQRRAKCYAHIYVLVRSQMRYDPINNYIMAVQNMLEARDGMRRLTVLRCYSVEIVLCLRKVLELCAPEVGVLWVLCGMILDT